MDSNAKKALKQVKMEIAAEYEMYPRCLRFNRTWL